MAGAERSKTDHGSFIGHCGGGHAHDMDQLLWRRRAQLSPSREFRCPTQSTARLTAQGLLNIFWVPAAHKFGRRPVFIITTVFCLASAVYTGFMKNTGDWFGSLIINGIGTSAYEAVIQLAVRPP